MEASGFLCYQFLNSASSNLLLNVKPPQLRSKKNQTQFSLRLSNNTDKHVAFKFYVTANEYYCVDPPRGVISPHCTRDVVFIMKASPEVTRNARYRLQSMDVSSEDANFKIFKESGNTIKVCRFKIMSLPTTQTPSPVVLPIKDEELISSTLINSSPILEDVSSELILSLVPKEDEGLVSTLTNPFPPVPKEAERISQLVEGINLAAKDRAAVLNLIQKCSAVLQEGDKLHAELESLRRRRNIMCIASNFYHIVNWVFGGFLGKTGEKMGEKSCSTRSRRT